MSLVCTNKGVELHYEVSGDRRDPLVMLIAGAGAPAQFWPDDFCEALSNDGRQVLRFWHRDTGHSAHFEAPYDIEALMSDVLALQHAVGAAQACIVGHSMGGYIAQLIACRQSNRVSGCVAMASGPIFSEEGKERLGLSSPDESLWPLLMANQPSGDFEADFPGWMASWRILNGELDVEEPRARAYTRALYEGSASNHQIAENHIHAVSTTPDALAEELSHCNVPMLYLTGERDPLVPPDHGAKAAQIALDGAFQSLPGAGHMYFNTSTWDLILHSVSQFIAAIEGPRKPSQS